MGDVEQGLTLKYPRKSVCGAQNNDKERWISVSYHPSSKLHYLYSL